MPAAVAASTSILSTPMPVAWMILHFLSLPITSAVSETLSPTMTASMSAISGRWALHLHRFEVLRYLDERKVATIDVGGMVGEHERQIGKFGSKRSDLVKRHVDRRAIVQRVALQHQGVGTGRDLAQAGA